MFNKVSVDRGGSVLLEKHYLAVRTLLLCSVVNMVTGLPWDLVYSLQCVVYHIAMCSVWET